MDWSFDDVMLVRHGETEWNAAGRRQGQLDSPLTDRGRAQAEAVAALASHCNTDAIFASPLGRARTTAQVISSAINQPIQLLDDLGEVDHGEFAGLTGPEIEARWPGSLAARDQNKYNWRFPGGESYRDVTHRAQAALEVMATRSSKRPLVVAHAMLGRMLIGCLLELPPDEALQWAMPQGTILRIDPNNQQTEVLTIQ